MKAIKYCPAFFLTVTLASIAGCATNDEGSSTRAGSRQSPGTYGTESRQSPGAYMDDAWITTKVKTAIANDRSLSAFAINVETHQGTVQLSGFVDSRDEINRATEVAQRVEGVQSVQNNLQVKGNR